MVDRTDVEKFVAYAKEENLDAVVVAVVTDKNRLTMTWRGKTICDISRDFLNTNGAAKTTRIHVTLPDEKVSPFTQETSGSVAENWFKTLSSLNVCSQKGLVERFDSTIGAGSVLLPLAASTSFRRRTVWLQKFRSCTAKQILRRL